MTETKVVKRQIDLKNPPSPLDLKSVDWYVITAENFDEFKQRFIEENGDFVFYAMSVNDYERMAINFAEITRYIDQQKQIIIYYENAISN